MTYALHFHDVGDVLGGAHLMPLLYLLKRRR